MINGAELATLRLRNQQLVNPTCRSAEEVVQYMGAMQAQDYNMAKWAVGVRMPGSRESLIEESLNRGDIIRTHLLRPTWHLVAAADIHWLLELTAPQVKKCMASSNRKMGLDETVFKKSNALIEQALANNTYLTRDELMSCLQAAGIVTNDIRSAHLMMNAELDGLVCNGPRRGLDGPGLENRAKQFTYALLQERVPARRNLSREEALSELAKRYFVSHGPATLKDFIWWSGLTVTDVRKAIEGAKADLQSISIDSETYWLGNTSADTSPLTEHIHLLPSFDEFMVSYCDRSASLDPLFARRTNTGNGIFHPIIVVNGQVVGVWKRTVKPKGIAIELTFFYSLANDLIERINEQVNQYISYTEMKLLSIS